MRHTDPMPFIISTILFVLAVVLVVLTRLRLAKDDAPVAGRLDIPTALVNAHTAVGALALVLWGAYLFFDVDWVVGFLGLLLWWATTVDRPADPDALDAREGQARLRGRAGTSGPRGRGSRCSATSGHWWGPSSGLPSS